MLAVSLALILDRGQFVLRKTCKGHFLQRIVTVHFCCDQRLNITQTENVCRIRLAKTWRCLPEFLNLKLWRCMSHFERGMLARGRWHNLIKMLMHFQVM